jgi:hypothetical protein
VAAAVAVLDWVSIVEVHKEEPLAQVALEALHKF